MGFEYECLLKGNVIIQNYNIAICVIKSPTTKASNAKKIIDDFLYCQPGGPGFSGIDSYIDDVKALHEKAIEQELTLPHVILYDPLGCGASDKARDVSEYNVMNYVHMNALIIEEIKKRLNLNKMNLHISGGSFGGMTAMLAPIVRPEWVNPDSSTGIHIKQIIGRAPANGAGLKEDTIKFLQDRFANDPEKLAYFIKAQEKLFSGFESQEDYIRNFVLVVAELYAVNGKEIAESTLGKLIARNPDAAIFYLKCQRWIKDVWGSDTSQISKQIQIIGGCSLPVINRFFTHNFDGIKVHEKVIAEEIYASVPLCLVTSLDDHAVRPDYSLAIQAARPSNTCAIVLKSPHMIEGRSKDFYSHLLLSLVTQGKLDEDLLSANKDIVHQAVYTKEYVQNLKKSYLGGSVNGFVQYDPAYIYRRLDIAPDISSRRTLEGEPEKKVEAVDKVDREFNNELDFVPVDLKPSMTMRYT